MKEFKLNIHIPQFTLLFSCNTAQAFVKESLRTKEPYGVTGAYAIACDGMPPVSGKHDIIAYIVKGNLWQRLVRYGYHLDKGEACVLPHRDVHRTIESTLAAGRKVEVYVRRLPKNEAQLEERHLKQLLSPRCNKR